ncbi:unnamed protein product [Cuscuta campestris]|uniref:Uncharacterized protein n=1 Tax=Cuscuta campestris TaxID=132261 RepID=A0A484NB59_9ASTE|nr:unnamed protein product [Cuscuta campestris]
MIPSGFQPLVFGDKASFSVVLYLRFCNEAVMIICSASLSFFGYRIWDIGDDPVHTLAWQAGIFPGYLQPWGCIPSLFSSQSKPHQISMVCLDHGKCEAKNRTGKEHYFFCVCLVFLKDATENEKMLIF